MKQWKQIDNDVFWIGSDDRRLALFENVFPIPNGISYNSYFVDDEKTVLLDTVDKAVSEVFFDNLTYLLHGRELDYVIINHMEPDHCATLGELVLHYPNVKIIGNVKTFQLINQFFTFETEQRSIVVKEGDTICTGKHTFQFFMAPMVHWPEVMVTYDQSNRALYSADAFGTFGALNGHIFADMIDFEGQLLPEARRYYSNIVGKFGIATQALLKKASALEIAMICPLHGPVWRKDIEWYIDKYEKWSTYQPEMNAIMVAFGSIYGHTENAVNILTSELDRLGISNIAVYDVSSTDPSIIVSEAYRCSHIVLASATYNGGVFSKMGTVLHDLKFYNVSNRTVALIENGSWAPMAAKVMKDELLSMKNITILDRVVTIRSAVKEEQYEELQALAKDIAESIKNSN